jgi:hypothetical protein
MLLVMYLEKSYQRNVQFRVSVVALNFYNMDLNLTPNINIALLINSSNANHSSFNASFAKLDFGKDLQIHLRHKFEYKHPGGMPCLESTKVRIQTFRWDALV